MHCTDHGMVVTLQIKVEQTWLPRPYLALFDIVRLLLCEERISGYLYFYFCSCSYSYCIIINTRDILPFLISCLPSLPLCKLLPNSNLIASKTEWSMYTLYAATKSGVYYACLSTALHHCTLCCYDGGTEHAWQKGSGKVVNSLGWFR